MNLLVRNVLIRCGLSAGVMLGMAIAASLVSAADPTFVGVLSMAIDKEVAEKIGISDDVRTKLQDLVNNREEEALELAIEIKDLPAAERAAKLAPFVAESEKQGLALLDDAQKAKLEQVRVGRKGMETLSEADIAKKLALTDTQKSQVTKTLDERAKQIEEGGESKRSTTVAYYERQLAKILSPEQKTQWDALAGLQPGEKSPAEAPPMERTGPSSVAEQPSRGRGESSRSGTGTGSSTTAEPKVETIVRSTIKPSEDGKIQFNFRYAPWKDVLDFFAGTADLSLDAVSFPPGTCNYTDTKRYTVGEAMDILNAMLQTRGYMLVRRERLLILVNLEEGGLARGLIPIVSPKELDGLGQFEIVGCLFHLKKYVPEEAEADLKKIIGAQGSMQIMPNAKAILVYETAGTLRMIRRLVDGVENPETNDSDEFVEITVKNVLVEEVLPSVRDLLGMPPDRNALPDGSLKFAVDSFASRFLVTGKPDKIAKMQEVVKLVDKSTAIEGSTTNTVIETPQLVVYTISSAEPTSVLKVLQTLLADLPDVRMELDPKTGNLIVLARPSQHATVKATLDEMQQNPSEFEVFLLRKLDVSLAILTLNKLYNAGEGGDPKAPKIDGDPITRQLIVRGTANQIAEIKSFLEKMGENDTSPITLSSDAKSNIRIISGTGSQMQKALDQVQAVWGTSYPNRIRIITPAESDTPAPMGRSVIPNDPIDAIIDEYVPPSTSRPPMTPAPSTTQPMKPVVPSANRSTTHSPRRVPVRFAAYQAPAEEAVAPATAKQPAAPASAPEATPTTPTDAPPQKPSKPGAEIIVTFGPAGVVIASEDLEALDEFETLLRSMLDSAALNAGPEFTVFNLKFAKAEIAASLLSEMIGASTGASADSGGGGGGGLMNSMLGAALGDAGGGLMGSLFGLDGGGGGGSATPSIATAGKVTVIPDPRLNRLVVQAGPADLDLVEQLLKIIDQENSPVDVQLQPKARMIPVKYVSADEVAAVVKEVYAARISGGGAGGGQQRQQPSPEDFMRALRGGRGGGGQQQKQRGEEVKMTIGVDKRSNSLVVSAPDPLFEEVKLLVAEIDHAGTEAAEIQSVITLKRTSPEVVAKGLQSILGPNAKTNITTSTTQQAQSGASATAGQGSRGGGRGGQSTQSAGQSNPFQQLIQQGLQGGAFGGGRGGQTGGFGGGRGGQTGGRGGGRGGN